jgi:shikimate kinase
MNVLPYSRIVIVGTTSSGKSTLANRLAKLLHADFIELDALHWEPNWVEAPNEVFRARVETATRSLSWVAAGNYHVARDIVWSRAEVEVISKMVNWRLNPSWERANGSYR